MFRSPISSNPATDADGRITGTRHLYYALDDDQRAEILEKMPRARISNRGGVIEVFVPVDEEK